MSTFVQLLGSGSLDSAARLDDGRRYIGRSCNGFGYRRGQRVGGKGGEHVSSSYGSFIGRKTNKNKKKHVQLCS